LKLVRMTSSSVTSLVSSRQFKPIFSIYANKSNSQSDGGASNLRVVLNLAMGKAVRLDGFLPATKPMLRLVA
jgi:hypothetical protein